MSDEKGSRHDDLKQYSGRSNPHRGGDRCQRYVGGDAVDGRSLRVPGALRDAMVSLCASSHVLPLAIIRVVVRV